MKKMENKYEKELKVLNPKLENMTYDISDLFPYLDQLADISLMVFQDAIHAYLPRNRDWVKRQMFSHLQGQAVR